MTHNTTLVLGYARVNPVLKRLPAKSHGRTLVVTVPLRVVCLGLTISWTMGPKEIGNVTVAVPQAAYVENRQIRSQGIPKSS